MDVCETDFAQRKIAYRVALRVGLNVVTTAPVAESYDVSRRTVDEFESRNLKFAVVDTLRNHPLIVLAQKLIYEEKKIGNPRILRLESVIYDKRLQAFSLMQGLMNGIRACELLFESRAVFKVFASEARTKYSSFFVTLSNLSDECTAHIVAGNSAKQGKFGFAINGTGGMLSFDESKTLELPGEIKYSDVLKSATSVEVLFATFSNLLRSREGEIQTPSFPSTQRVVDAVLRSSKTREPITISY